MQQDNIISIQGLSKIYTQGGSQLAALSNLNLNIKAGEIFGIIGRSGAGKSTLIRCVNLLETPSAGNVYVNQLNMRSLNATTLRIARRKIGMIFQHFNLLESRTVFENIALPLELVGMPQDKINKKVNSLIELVELQRHHKHYPSQLSGGQKQRVAIARALANSPTVLLCDEATSSLDPRSTHAILDLLRAINKELNLTIMLITHEMDVVKAICDRVAVLHEGQIIEEGPVLTVFTHPKTQVARDLIKMASRMEIPKSLRRQLKQTPDAQTNTRLMRIAYQGDSTSQPIIGYLITHFSLTINIIQANIETIQEQTIGVLVVEVSGTEENIQNGLQFLENNDLQVEILGYVQRTPTRFN